MYGKLENGILIFASKTIKVNGMVHYHPNAELYAQFGFLPIEDTPYPKVDMENPKYYAESYIEQDGRIVKVWTETEPPIPEELIPTLEDKIVALDNRVSINEQSITNTELALTEVYEMLEGEIDG